MARFVAVLLLSLAGIGNAFAFNVPGLKVPESFIIDEETGAYYISNINGAPTEMNGNGFITKLNPDGSVDALKFIEGGRDLLLNAPKGLLIVGDLLYVSDIDEVRAFNKTTGKEVEGIDLRSFSPKFLNDLAVDPQGYIYVTDMGTNRIFSINPSDKRVKVLVDDKNIGSPNGIVYDKTKARLLFVTWDTGLIYQLSRSGSFKRLFDLKFKSLDGIDLDDKGNIYVSSFTGGKVYRITRRGKVKEISTGLVTPADISLDRKKKKILVPSFNGNRVFLLDY